MMIINIDDDDDTVLLKLSIFHKDYEDNEDYEDFFVEK